MTDFSRLPTRDRDGCLRVVVEAPRGSRGKFAFDPETESFTLSKTLTLGLTYPFDWGFVPSTLGGDGDPLDAMVLHDVSTYPGMVLPCRLIGVLRLVQVKKGKRERNDRVITVPLNAKRDDVKDVRDLPSDLLEELEEFFKETDAIEDKKVNLQGWSGPKAAGRVLTEAMRLFKKSERRRGSSG